MTIQKGFRNRVRLSLQAAGHKVARRLLARPYAFVFPQCHRVYSPWFEPSFLNGAYGKIKDRTLLYEDKAYFLECLVRYASHIEGDMAECGVYRGGSAYLIASTLSAEGADRELHLFDTFEGMPSSARPETDRHSQGDFGDTSAEDVERFLGEFSSRVRFHVGLIPDTFVALPEKKYSLVHVDVDIYSATMDCLSYFYPRMPSGGVFLFDDYGYRIYEQAEKKAADDFFADKPEKPIAHPSGQAFLIRQ